MPDLQTALSTVAKQINFDDVEEVNTPRNHKNFAHELFYWFVDNPASTAAEAVAGINSAERTDVSGRIFQMWSRGLLSRAGNSGSYRYTATRTEYPEFTTEMRQKQMRVAIEARLSKAKKPKAAKAKPVEAKPLPISGPRVTLIPTISKTPCHDAAQIVNNMSVGLAKAVYLELKQVFES